MFNFSGFAKSPESLNNMRPNLENLNRVTWLVQFEILLSVSRLEPARAQLEPVQRRGSHSLKFGI